ncbi:MAG TPA: FAD-dependent monooxygenase [Leptolyngbyaceae cyanobacterium]
MFEQNSHQTKTEINEKNTNHALVIGGSMAGLLAARVLADYFDKVTIVDRDRFPEQPSPRKGVPQSGHAHVLLMRGQGILEEFFPGLGAELEAADAPFLDWISDCQMLGMKGWELRFSSGLVTRTCSRNLLEFTVRQRLSGYSNIEFLQESWVTELLLDKERNTITGVRIKLDRESDTKEIFANLVIDASGRRSNATKWLESLGYSVPQETIVNSFLGYASRVYQQPTNYQIDWKGLIIWQKPPDGTKGGMIYPVEKNRWIVTLAGVEKDYPPTDETGFLEFARQMRSPALYEAIKNAEPISDIYGYRATENRFRHYEKISKWPEQFCIIGDAVCAFNPIYGQGMTVCALSALTLQKCLQKQSQLTGFSQHFQQELVKVYDTPWMMATSEDFRWRTTEGGKPDLNMKIMHWYLDRIKSLTSNHPQMWQTFIEVLHMVKPPSALFKPSILCSVLSATIRQLAQRKTYLPFQSNAASFTMAAGDRGKDY